MEGLNEENIKINKISKYFDSSFFKALIAISIYAFIFYGFDNILKKIISFIFKDLASNQANLSILSAINNLIIYSLIFILLFIIYRKNLKDDYKNITDTHKFGRYIIISFIVMICANMISAMIQRSIINQSSTNENSINETLKNPYAFLLMSPIVVIFGPLVEELIFRKSMFNLIKNKNIALVISSLTFGLMHVITSYAPLYQLYQNPTKALLHTLALGIPYVTSGFVFGGIYLNSNNNIYSSTSCHIANNFLATLSYFLLK